MRKNNTKIEQYRRKDLELRIYGCVGDENNGIFEIEIEHRKYNIIASNGEGWEHISISGKNTPNWKVMCIVKDLFWEDEETVVQFHPPKSEYVNNCDTCLHLWKKIGCEFELPPTILTGIK